MFRLKKSRLRQEISKKDTYRDKCTGKAEVYLNHIDPIVRNTIGSIHTDVDFAIISYLFEKEEATFAQIGVDLDLAKNALAYSLRKMVQGGTVVNYHIRTGKEERSIYELSDFTRDLFHLTKNLLQELQPSTFGQESETFFAEFQNFMQSKEASTLFQKTLQDTFDGLLSNFVFANQMSRICASRDVLSAIAVDNVAWKHFVTTLNLSLERLSSEIRIHALKHEIPAEGLKWILYSQIIGYVILNETFTLFRDSMNKLWRETRQARLKKAESLLTELEAKGFDSLRDFELIKIWRRSVDEKEK